MPHCDSSEALPHFPLLLLGTRMAVRRSSEEVRCTTGCCWHSVSHMGSEARGQICRWNLTDDTRSNNKLQ